MNIRVALHETRCGAYFSILKTDARYLTDEVHRGFDVILCCKLHARRIDMGSFCSPLSVLRFRTNIIVPLQYAIQANNYAKVQTGAAMKGKKKLKLGPIMEKKILPVETDPQKLVKFVCGSNILKEGQDVEIKPDSEYPDWLWNIHIGPPITLEEMDPSTKQYWRKVRKLGIKRNNLLASLKPF